MNQQRESYRTKVSISAFIVSVFLFTFYGCASGPVAPHANFYGKTSYDYRMTSPLIMNLDEPSCRQVNYSSDIVRDGWTKETLTRAADYLYGKGYTYIGEFRVFGRMEGSLRIKEMESRGADVAVFIDCYSFSPDSSTDMGLTAYKDHSTGMTRSRKAKIPKGEYVEGWDLYKCIKVGTCEPVDKTML